MQGRFNIRGAFAEGRLLFAGPDSPGRMRRPLDALLVVVAALLFITASVLASVNKVQEQRLVHAAATLLGWSDGVWRAAYSLALVYGLFVVAATLLSRRWRLSRDLLVAIALVLAIGFPAGRAARPNWPTLAEGFWKSSGEYPALRLAAAVAVLMVAGPELTRTARLTALWLVIAAGAGAVVLGIGYPSSVLGGIALGIAAAGIVRLGFGSSEGFPTIDRVRKGLTELGVTVGKITIAPRQRPGAATYLAVDDTGHGVHVIVLGRDAQDTQRLANLYRNLAYRDAGPDFATGRLHQIEHESLITLLADRAGVRVPRVGVAGVVESGDAILVLGEPTEPPVEAATSELGDDFLAALWKQAASLRTARLAHSALNLSNVVDTDAGPMIIRFNRGRLAAPDVLLNIDLAELLVATSIATSPERALKSALDAVGQQPVEAALPFLQRAALTPHLRNAARAHELKLDDLRSRAAAATGVDPPKIAPLHRFRLRDLLMTVVAISAAYFIITKLAKIDFGTVYTELRHAEWSWLVLALVIGQLTFATHAVSLRGAVLTPLPFLPCVALQAAIKFINVSVPNAAARIGVNIRFLQRQGVSTGEAIASGAVDSVTDTIVTIAIALLVLPLVHVRTQTLPLTHGKGATPWLLIGLLAGTVVIGLAAMANPNWRVKVVPQVRNAWRGMVAVARTRNKRMQLFGGSIATQILWALTLGAVCHAFGVRLSLAQLLFVILAASVFATLIPVPGGVGVAEAGLTAGLVTFGVDQPIAFAAAVTYRLCSYYLPPIWGFVALRWLSRKGYL